MGSKKYCLFVGLSTSQHIHSVTFEWNILLDLSGGAVTKTFCSLVMKLLLQVLGKSTWRLAIWMICGDEGVGNIPGVRGVQGVCRFCAT